MGVPVFSIYDSFSDYRFEQRYHLAARLLEGPLSGSTNQSHVVTYLDPAHYSMEGFTVSLTPEGVEWAQQIRATQVLLA